MEGWATDSLVATYDEERRPVFASTARDFIETFIADDRAFLARYDPDRDRIEFEAAWDDRASGSNVGVLTFEPHYEGSRRRERWAWWIVMLVDSVAGFRPRAADN